MQTEVKGEQPDRRRRPSVRSVSGWVRQLAALSVLGLLLVLLNWAFLEDIDALAFDLCLRIRGEQPPDPRIIIVAIDDASLAELGNWPWTPEVLARLFRQILADRPALVGVDLILGRSLESYFDPGADRVVLADSLGSADRDGPGPGWQAPAPDIRYPGISLAHIHAAKDADGVCRSIPLSVQYSGIRRWAFSVELARRFLGVPADEVGYSGKVLQLGSHFTVPRMSTPIDRSMDAAGVLASLPSDILLLNSRGAPGTFPYLSAARVLEGSAAGRMEDRIVLVGATAYALGDHLGTAFSGFTEMPGIEIHANALDTILNRRFLTAVEEPWRTALMVGILILSWLLLELWLPARRLWVFGTYLAAVVGVSLGSFLVLNHWTGLVGPLVAASLAGASSQFLRYTGLNRRLNRRFAELSGLLREVLPSSPVPSETADRGNLEWKIDLLGDAAEAALRLSRERAETAAFVTHELKTPLTSIQGFAELLQLEGSLEEEERREAARYIESESKRLAALVQDYLQLARLEQGGVREVRTGFDLADILRRAAETASVDARSKSIAIIVDLPPGTALPVTGDPELIHQVFVNLLGNAVKFSVSGTGVVVSGRHEDGWVMGSVRDQGCGIPAEQLGRVFDKFFRGSPGSGESPPGSGLGLAFVRQVVERHGGRVEVGSQVGAGSTFTVRLRRRS